MSKIPERLVACPDVDLEELGFIRNHIVEISDQDTRIDKILGSLAVGAYPRGTVPPDCMGAMTVIHFGVVGVRGGTYTDLDLYVQRDESGEPFLVTSNGELWASHTESPGVEHRDVETVVLAKYAKEWWPDYTESYTFMAPSTDTRCLALWAHNDAESRLIIMYLLGPPKYDATPVVDGIWVSINDITRIPLPPYSKLIVNYLRRYITDSRDWSTSEADHG